MTAWQRYKKKKNSSRILKKWHLGQLIFFLAFADLAFLFRFLYCFIGLARARFWTQWYFFSFRHGTWKPHKLFYSETHFICSKSLRRKNCFLLDVVSILYWCNINCLFLFTTVSPKRVFLCGIGYNPDSRILFGSVCSKKCHTNTYPQWRQRCSQWI